MRWIDQRTLEPMLDTWKVSSKADVFGVGTLLRCLLTHQQDQDQPLFLEDRDVQSLNLNGPGPWNHYSGELRSIMRKCLQFRPEDRPTFPELLDEIRWHVEEDWNEGFDLADHMRSGTAPQQTIDMEEVVMHDAYAIGLSRDGSDGLPARKLRVTTT